MPSMQANPSFSVVRMGLVLMFALVGASVAHADEFDLYHPDEHYRRLGLKAWDEGHQKDAVRYLTRAARYADKGAQLALAFLYLEGSAGTAPDPALAYAWADLAAERGYPEFLAVRERVWNELDEAQRQRAREVGAGLYAEYGDDVAKPRLEGLLRSGLARKTGSHAGSAVGTLAVAEIDSSARAAMLAGVATHPDAGGSPMNNQLAILFESLAGRGNAWYYNDANWQPEDYWAAKDRVWRKLEGAVEIAPLRKVEGQGSGHG